MLNEALKHLGQARELRPSWSRIVACAGVVHGQLGQIDSALNDYLEAIELGDRNPAIIQRAIQMLFAKQRYEDANRLLHQFEQQRMNFSTDMSRLSTSLALQEKDFDPRRGDARKAAAGSKAFDSHLWLGQVLGVVARQAKADGQTQKAEKLSAEAGKAYRRAVEIEPKRTMTWVALDPVSQRERDERPGRAGVQRSQSEDSGEGGPPGAGPMLRGHAKLRGRPKEVRSGVGRGPQGPSDRACRGRLLLSHEECEEGRRATRAALSTARWHRPTPTYYGRGGNWP